MPDSTWLATLPLDGRKASRIRASPARNSQMPTIAAITRSEMSGHTSTATPSATASRPVNRKAHQGKGCAARTSATTPYGASSDSVMAPAWGRGTPTVITPGG
ncbi:hypothetical protein Abr02nite_58510 [Paractinoplanes brasiliensis]|nr:hypothetical protein Abr02nite_58510 [Actinoplanes brasiliensis]